MGCTYSAPRYIDSSNIKPSLVYIEESSDINDKKLYSESVINNNHNNKSKKMLRKLYGF